MLRATHQARAASDGQQCSPNLFLPAYRRCLRARLHCQGSNLVKRAPFMVPGRHGLCCDVACSNPQNRGPVQCAAALLTYLPPTMMPGAVTLCHQCPKPLYVYRGPLANRVAASDAASARAADGTTRDAEQAGRLALWRSVAAALQLSDAQRAEIAAVWQLLR